MTEIMSRACWLPEYILIILLKGITFYLLLIIQNVIKVNGLNELDYQSNKIPGGANRSSSSSSHSTVSLSVPAKTELFHPAYTHHLVKRMDLEFCLGHFDIHKDTIIRTAESQAIGGMYLQGLQLGTPDECQRLCCETDGCDVYIFENKQNSYCYLFKCGPSDNFHCKFTRHANYTSAVLVPPLQLPDTASTTPPTTTAATTTTTTTTRRPHQTVSFNANISQQEKELSSLKLKEVHDVKGISVASDNSKFDSGLNSKIFSEIARIGPSSIINTPLGVQKPVIQNFTVFCGRFQFACHSGECIAVYNACDGIPQCEDGSDEGPECSGAAAFSNATPIKSHSGISSQGVDVSKEKSGYQQLINVQSQNQAERIQPPPSIVNNREDADAWINRKTFVDNQQSRFGNLSDTNSQVFNHKSGIQLPINALSSFTNVNQTSSAYADQEENSIALLQNALTNYKTVDAIPKDQQFQLNQAHVAVVPPDINLPPSNYLQQLQSNLANPVKSEGHLMYSPPHQSISKQNINIPSIQPHELGPQISVNSLLNPDEVPQHESRLSNSNFSQIKPLEGKDQDMKKQFFEPKKQPIEQEESFPTRSRDALEPALLQQLQHLASPSPVHEQNEIIHEKLVMEFREHDGFSDRPGGAILSLILGLIITVALAVLIGCRLRKVRRRSRRLGGKTPYSHDADFLVNGMYL